MVENILKEMKQNMHFPLFLIFFLFLSPFPCTAAQDLVHETCTKCAENDPNISFNFCLASLQAAPNSADDLHHLGLFSIKLLRCNLTNSRSHIRHLLKNKTLDPFVRSCLHDCFDLYSDAIPATKQALQDYQDERFYDANIGVSSAIDASTTCEDGFHGREGVVSPLTKRNNDTFLLSALSLSIINMLSPP